MWSVLERGNILGSGFVCGWGKDSCGLTELLTSVTRERNSGNHGDSHQHPSLFPGCVQTFWCTVCITKLSFPSGSASLQPPCPSNLPT